MTKQELQDFAEATALERANEALAAEHEMRLELAAKALEAYIKSPKGISYICP